MLSCSAGSRRAASRRLGRKTDLPYKSSVFLPRSGPSVRLTTAPRFVLLQVEEGLHAGILGHVAQSPIVCDAHNGDPCALKCSGEVNSPCAKVSACGENACTRLPAPPLRRHKVRSAPFLPAAKTSLRSLAPPPPRRPTALGSSGAPQDGAPRSWATGKSKAARRAALLQNSETYFRLKKAFIPGYSAMSPSSSSMRSSWLYLATRSVRLGAPVLIWPALRATEMSAMVVSSVSPER